MSARRYVETSALLRALLEGDDDLRAALRGEGLFTSELTFVEAARSVRRARREGRLDAAAAREVERQLAGFERTCVTIGLEDEVLRVAREDLPVEPVRTLDALHLASIRTLDAELGAFEVLSCDERVRQNASALGFRLSPVKSS